MCVIKKTGNKREKIRPGRLTQVDRDRETETNRQTEKKLDGRTNRQAMYKATEIKLGGHFSHKKWKAEARKWRLKVALDIGRNNKSTSAPLAHSAVIECEMLTLTPMRSSGRLPAHSSAPERI